MKRLSEFVGDEALEVIATITEPIMLIIADEKIHELAEANAPYVKFIQPIISGHKAEVVTILSALNCMSEEEYRANMNLLTLPKELLDLMKDPDVQQLFHYAK